MTSERGRDQQARDTRAGEPGAGEPRVLDQQMGIPRARDPESDLDPALLRAIRPSAGRIAADEEAFVLLLHSEIRNLVRHLPDGGRGFCERTARTVFWLAASDHQAEAAIEGLNWLATANQADGFPMSEYVSVGHALVRAAHEASGKDWTSATGSAWIRLFMWIQPHLLVGARQAAARQAAATGEDQTNRQDAVDVDASAAASLLDDEDEDYGDSSYDQIMLGMTSRRSPTGFRPR